MVTIYWVHFVQEVGIKPRVSRDAKGGEDYAMRFLRPLETPSLHLCFLISVSGNKPAKDANRNLVVRR